MGRTFEKWEAEAISKINDVAVNKRMEKMRTKALVMAIAISTLLIAAEVIVLYTVLGETIDLAFKISLSLSVVATIIITVLMHRHATTRAKLASKLFEDILETDTVVKEHYHSAEDTALAKLALISELLASKLNFDADDIKAIGEASKLADVGKVALDEELLHKVELSEGDIEKIQKHTEIGYKISQVMSVEPIIQNIIRYHREKWDGSGYPHKLKAEDIPLGARIVSITDTYDALRHDRPHRKGFTHTKAMSIIAEDAGSSYDPRLVAVFQKESDKIEAIYKHRDGEVVKILDGIEDL